MIRGKTAGKLKTGLPRRNLLELLNHGEQPHQSCRARSDIMSMNNTERAITSKSLKRTDIRTDARQRLVDINTPTTNDLFVHSKWCNHRSVSFITTMSFKTFGGYHPRTITHIPILAKRGQQLGRIAKIHPHALLKMRRCCRPLVTAHSGPREVSTQILARSGWGRCNPHSECRRITPAESLLPGFLCTDTHPKSYR